MRRTGTSHAPRATPMSIHKIEIGVKPFPNFPICSKETPVIPASLPPHRQTGVLHEISDTAKAVLLYTFGRSLTCFQPGGWFR